MTGNFTGKTINADTGVVEQHELSVARPAGIFGLLPALFALGLFALVFGQSFDLSAWAQTSAPDASSIVTTAQNTFYSVGALIVAIIGFFIIAKIVKWVRK
jgi:hypothetical protein